MNHHSASSVNDVSLWLEVAANVAIFAGYVFIALKVVPYVTVNLKRTRIGALGFFSLCGLHHLEGAVHLIVMPEENYHEAMLSWHMLLVDVPQAFFVWLFVTGLYLELVKWGPWNPQTGWKATGSALPHNPGTDAARSTEES